jgi:hypothetical protein
MKKAIVLATTILLVSCDGDDGDSSSGGGSNVSNPDTHAPQPVSYSVDPVYGPTCNRVSDVSEAEQFINCTWYCGTDNVYDHQYVSINFVRSEGKWKKDGVLVTDGICSDHATFGMPLTL